MKDGDFFLSSSGNLNRFSWRNRRLGRLTDWVFMQRLHANPEWCRMQEAMKADPVRRVLIATVSVPGREQDCRRVLDGLARSRHHVDFAVIRMADRGKFDNISEALRHRSLDDYDWVIITDDDITTPDGLLDACLHLASREDLAIFQPAHRFRSYATFTLTQRHWKRLARVTHFVESGPLTGFRSDALKRLLPFPSMRWAWGIDVYWSELARRMGWNIGIIDAVPIRHLRPVANAYNFGAAMDEARAFLDRYNIDRPKQDILRTVRQV